MVWYQNTPYHCSLLLHSSADIFTNDYKTNLQIHLNSWAPVSCRSSRALCLICWLFLLRRVLVQPTLFQVDTRPCHSLSTLVFLHYILVVWSCCHNHSFRRPPERFWVSIDFWILDPHSLSHTERLQGPGVGVVSSSLCLPRFLRLSKALHR